MKEYQTIDARTLRDRLSSDDRPVLVNALAREGFAMRGLRDARHAP